MPGQTTEHAFETCVEEILLTRGGWHFGSVAEWDKQRVDGTKIVVTTLQKFPFVLRGLLHTAGAQSQEEATAAQKAEAAQWEAAIAKRRYAIIVDEAHSSQTGETARELKAILGAATNRLRSTVAATSI